MAERFIPGTTLLKDPVTDEVIPSPPLPEVTPEQKERQNFLKIIRMIESSGGKNYDHRQIESGQHKGHRAIGQYGLMPNTVNEVIRRSRQNEDVPQQIERLTSMDPVKMKEHMEANPYLEDFLADKLAQYVLNRQQDPEKAAYSWFMGHNYTPEEIEQRGYKDHDYVQKYNRYNKLFNKLK